jgi:superfamily II DNA or RNA helicase
MSIKFRPYQETLYANIQQAWAEGAQNVMPVAPTGSGKTVIIGQAMQDESGGSLYIAHRGELLIQSSLALARNGVTHRVIGTGDVARACTRAHIDEVGRNYVNVNARAGVASVDTLVRMEADAFLRSIRTWVVDEGHHLLRDNKWGRAVALLPAVARGMAPTASPQRTDKKGLGRHADGLVDRLVLGPAMRWLIEESYLSRYRIVGVPPSVDVSDVPVAADGDYSQPALRKKFHGSRIVGDVVSHYLKWVPGKRGLTFAVDVESATEIAKGYRAEGVPAEVVSAKTPDALRRQLLRDLRTGRLLQLVNVDLFGEGVDIPAIECISFARPTLSLVVYLQQFGRALRPFEGKDRAWILDHVGNVVPSHGLPDKHREWTLDRLSKRSSASGSTADRICPFCLYPYPRYAKVCPECGQGAVSSGRGAPAQVDGDLTLFDEETIRALMGERDRIDSTPFLPTNLSLAALANAKKNHETRYVAQQDLRSVIAQWCGWHKEKGREDSEIYKRFYLGFGCDILSAQTLGTTEAHNLMERVLHAPLEN